MTLTRISALGLLVVAPALLAQWPNHALPDEPRTPDGKVNLEGPVPKAADGHPDLSGIWDRGTPVGGPPPAGRGGGGTGLGPPRPAGPRPFQDLPSMFPDGLPMRPEAAAIRKRRLDDNSMDHPDAHCLPLHPVQLHSHPQPRKIVQTPGMVLIIYESNGGLRQIFTDGRSLPADDPQPWWYGYSIGHWDGDTLVVESLGFRDDGWLDEEGTPGSSQIKLTERFRRLNFGTLEIEVAVDDPVNFTRPWSITLHQRLMPDTELIEFVCAENNTSLKHLVGKQ